MAEKKYTLETPIKIGEEEIKEITLREPTGKSLSDYPVKTPRFFSATYDSSDLCQALKACDVPETTVARMTYSDIDSAFFEVMPFFGMSVSSSETGTQEQDS
jgi:hypothetical protein